MIIKDSMCTNEAVLPIKKKLSKMFKWCKFKNYGLYVKELFKLKKKFFFKRLMKIIVICN